MQQQVAALGRGGRIIGSSSKQRAASSSSSPIFAPLAWEWMTAHGGSQMSAARVRGRSSRRGLWATVDRGLLQQQFVEKQQKQQHQQQEAGSLAVNSPEGGHEFM